MDPLHHHHHHHAVHHHHAPLHWGYSGTGSAVAVATTGQQPSNTWIPPPTGTTGTNNSTTIHQSSTRKLKRTISESDCEDLYSEESSKEQTSPGESDSCHMMSRKKRRGVIEKKRRDRINLSLCELKRLVPSAYEKQGSAKLEKAEILQLTVDHLKQLHSKGSANGMPFDAQRFAVDYHIVGFRECATEVARYLVTMEGMDIQDPLRLRLMSHLQCFVAQRELQLKSNTSSSVTGLTDPLSPSSGISSSASPSVVNPVSPNMNQSSSWTSPAAYQQGYHHHHSQMYQQQQPPQPQIHQSVYGSQSATASGNGYVPNLPQYQDQYSRGDSTTSGYETSATGSSRSGVTTRAQAAQNSNNSGNNTNNNNNSSSSTSTGNDVTGGDQNGPTYTDLSSASSAPVVSSASDVATSSSTSSSSLATAATGAGNNRLQNNYNIYGHIHYPAESFGGHHHHLSGYNLHLGSSGGGLQSDLSSSRTAAAAGGYNAVVQGNGNSKPYRPWGAEMAY